MEGHEYDRVPLDCLLSVMGIVNCCIFLGGYTQQIQLITTARIMPTMLEFLEISYLIYEIWRPNRKLQKITMQTHFSNNLNKLLNLG